MLYFPLGTMIQSTNVEKVWRLLKENQTKLLVSGKQFAEVLWRWPL